MTNKSTQSPYDYSLLDPTKVPGKSQFAPPKKSTDITADPIDSPPQKPTSTTAKFEVKTKDPHPINTPAIYLAITLTILAALIPILPIPGLVASTLTIAVALAALIFNMQNTHLQAKSFPRLGFNPLHLITILDLYLIITSAIALVITLGSF